MTTRACWPVRLVMEPSLSSTCPLSPPLSWPHCAATTELSMVSCMCGPLSVSVVCPLPTLLSLLDFDWSVANEVLVSVSSDGTARLWDPASGACLREISEGGSGRALCCRFHPNNNNLVAVSYLLWCVCVHVHVCVCLCVCDPQPLTDREQQGTGKGLQCVHWQASEGND